jgi:hypothetical protein
VNLKVYEDIAPALFTERIIGFEVDVFIEKHLKYYKKIQKNK